MYTGESWISIPSTLYFTCQSSWWMLKSLVAPSVFSAASAWQTAWRKYVVVHNLSNNFGHNQSTHFWCLFHESFLLHPEFSITLLEHAFMKSFMTSGGSELAQGWRPCLFPFSQQAWNPVQGNFRRNLCFGWLSSSHSPVILWSHRALRSPLRSLSVLVSLMWEKTLSGETKVSDSPPVFPPAGPFRPSLPPLLEIHVRWQEERNTPSLSTTRGDFSLMRSTVVEITTHTARLSKRTNPQSGLNHFRNNLNFSIIVALRSFALWKTFYFLDCVLIPLVLMHLVFYLLVS